MPSLLVRDLIIGWNIAYQKKKKKGWNIIPVRKDERKIWKAASYCLLWAIWKERNRLVFENEEFSLNRLKRYFVYSLCSWPTLVVNYDSFVVSKLVPLAFGAGEFFFFLNFLNFFDFLVKVVWHPLYTYTFLGFLFGSLSVFQ